VQGGVAAVTRMTRGENVFFWFLGEKRRRGKKNRNEAQSLLYFLPFSGSTFFSCEEESFSAPWFSSTSPFLNMPVLGLSREQHARERRRGTADERRRGRAKEVCFGRSGESDDGCSRHQRSLFSIPLASPPPWCSLHFAYAIWKRVDLASSAVDGTPSLGSVSQRRRRRGRMSFPD